MFYDNYQPTWIKLWNNGERKKLTNKVIGFNKVDPTTRYYMGGCYLYAYSPKDIEGTAADHLDPSVIYIGTAGSSTHRGICSRTADFTGTVIRGIQQKNPYDNGTLFRIKYGEENKDNLYVAYMPLGYGSSIKEPAHRLEKQLQFEYIAKYGSLPSCDGPICTKDRIVELFRQLSTPCQEEIIKRLESI